MNNTASTNAWAASVRANKTGSRLGRAIRESRNDGTLARLADPKGFAVYILLDLANGVLKVAHKVCDDVWGGVDAAIEDSYRKGVGHGRQLGATDERRHGGHRRIMQEWADAGTFEPVELDGIAALLGIHRVTAATR